ncbi:hypothetical protein Moror_13920 [Moniliophthora roreri MCA 2997]|uniref:DUF6534 domain-containing protein n=1 Tax=Moniliophthora roreri (strain MCA 2997) TaxID=1381753 RepID=V2YTR7_MONRO|nr:hypothetical protein Moror_13920 [Moniliophthora roreri MCA 2997]
MDSTNNTAPAIPQNLHEHASSALLLDGIFQSFALGLVAGQAFKYYVDYRDDSKQKRIFAASVVLLSILQTIIEVYKLWLVTVHHKPWYASVLSWTDLFFNGCICSLCHSFFIRRCWKLTERSWVLYSLSSIATITAAVNIFLVINIGLIFTRDDSSMRRQFLCPAIQIGFTAWISLSLFLDVTVSSILVTKLWRSRTGTAAADNVVRGVISITFQSAVLPAISMIIAISLYRSSEGTNLTIFFTLMAGKFYAFGLLRTLNSRQKLRHRMESHDLGRVNLNSWQWNTAEIQRSSMIRSGETLHSDSPMVCGTTVRGSVSSSGCNSAAPHGDVPVVASGIPLEMQFSSPRLDAFERGGPRNRISSRP